jgi:hypothetical protein
MLFDSARQFGAERVGIDERIEAGQPAVTDQHEDPVIKFSQLEQRILELPGEMNGFKRASMFRFLGSTVPEIRPGLKLAYVFDPSTIQRRAKLSAIQADWFYGDRACFGYRSLTTEYISTSEVHDGEDISYSLLALAAIEQSINEVDAHLSQGTAVHVSTARG